MTTTMTTTITTNKTTTTTPQKSFFKAHASQEKRVDELDDLNTVGATQREFKYRNFFDFKALNKSNYTNF